MESARAEPEEPEQQCDKPKDLLSLPDDLLRACVRPLQGDVASCRAALASCKPVARALVRTSRLGLLLDVEREAPFSPSVHLMAQLGANEEPENDQASTLVLFGHKHSSPARCLAQLRGVRLAGVTVLGLQVRRTAWHPLGGVMLLMQTLQRGSSACGGPASRRRPRAEHGAQRCLGATTRTLARTQGLSLDELLPAGLGALLPNLREVEFSSCQLTAAARTSALDGALFGRLRTVSIQRLTVAATPQQPPQHVATAQLRQLAKLPSLSAVELKDDSCPALFLVALSTQLTMLHLHESYRQLLPGAWDTPTPAWRATLEQVARCTGLRELAIPCVTPEELRPLAPALQQVQRLRLSGILSQMEGDPVLDLLLALKHLTCLMWGGTLSHTCRRAHNDRPCSWRELKGQGVTPHLLARLPLHSLTQPVQWQALVLQRGTLLVDVRAAVANVTRHCPAGFGWMGDADKPPLCTSPTWPAWPPACGPSSPCSRR